MQGSGPKLTMADKAIVVKKQTNKRPMKTGPAESVERRALAKALLMKMGVQFACDRDTALGIIKIGIGADTTGRESG